MLPATFETGLRLVEPSAQQDVEVRALLLGERLDTRSLESGAVLATAPLALTVDGGGVAVLFRYGVAVLFGVEPKAGDALLATLAPFVAEPFPLPETETARVVIGAASDQLVDAAGNIVLRERSIERLQVVADVLAKSLVLGHYETRVAAAFDRIEPLAATLRDSGRPGARRKELLHLIGSVLGIQQRTVGRVETQEKPELLWEHPELERLYMRLAEEYELRDRDHALDRKLEIISRTVQTLLGLVQTRSSTRLEWYILLLIFAELILAAYPLLLHH
jgi:required for meiotic nuclear division protein 1